MNQSAFTSRRAFLGYGIAAAGLATLTLAGCAPASTSPKGGSTGGGVAKPSGKVALTMSAYGAVTRQQKLQQVYDLYTKKNGGSVNLEILANDQYTQKLTTEIAGGGAADVIALFNNIVAQFAVKQTLEPLDAYSPSILDISHFDESSLSSGVINGKRFALPLGDNAYGVIWDEGVLTSIGMKTPKPGQTWDDFIAFANDVTKKKGGGYFGTMDDSGDFNFFEIYLRQKGASLYTKDSKGLGFTKKDLEGWFEIWADLRKSKAAPPGDLTVQSSTGGFGNSLIVGGKAANFFIYPNVLSAFQALTKSPLALSTPPMPSAAKSGLFIRASNWVGVNAAGSHKSDAVDLIDFILNDKGAANILQAEFGAPPNTKLRGEIPFNAVDQRFIDYVDTVAKTYAHPIPSLLREFPNGSPQVQAAFVSISQSIATGKDTISSGTDSFFQQAAGFLG